jgi:hypothetical protein
MALHTVSGHKPQTTVLNSKYAPTVCGHKPHTPQERTTQSPLTYSYQVKHASVSSTGYICLRPKSLPELASSRPSSSSVYLTSARNARIKASNQRLFTYDFAWRSSYNLLYIYLGATLKFLIFSFVALRFLDANSRSNIHDHAHPASCSFQI